MADVAPVELPPALEARLLLRAARAATLATESGGQPFASLVTPATDGDLSVLMLLSGLSDHTRHLRENPRCSLMVMGEPDGPNIQTAPRLTVVGEAAPDPDPAMRARWVAHHPYAAFYADLPDFRVLRLRITGGHWIGGFARAARLKLEDLLPDPAAAEAVAAAEPRILAHCNEDHADALAAIAGRPGLWRMTQADSDGCDLTRDETVVRVAWPAPVRDADGVRQALVALARAARAA
jgi:putative heme iron utilization protein